VITTVEYIPKGDRCFARFIAYAFMDEPHICNFTKRNFAPMSPERKHVSLCVQELDAAVPGIGDGQTGDRFAVQLHAAER
jgi:hypothetical protein